MTISCGWAGRGELDEVREFVLRIYGPNAIQSCSGRFDWLCGMQPGGVSVSFAREDGRIIAACSHIPVTVHVSGCDYRGAYGLDFVVDPSKRRLGIGSRLLQLRLDTFPLSLSTGQSPAMGQLYARIGGGVVGPVSRALRVLRPPKSGTPRTLLRDWTAWGLGVARRSRTGVRRSVALVEALSLLAEYGSCLAPDEIGIRHSADDFSWRYSGPVYSDHEYWHVTDGRAQGLVVTRRQGASEVLLDVYASPEALPGVLAATVTSSEASRLTADFHGARLQAAFRASGWLVRPRGSRFVVMSSDRRLQERVTQSPWTLFGGESDIDLLRLPGAGPQLDV